MSLWDQIVESRWGGVSRPVPDEPYPPQREFRIWLDNDGQPHRETGSAIIGVGQGPDGGDLAEFYWRGVLVPELVVLRPESITADMIRDERNVEVRRVMLDRFGGWARFLAEVNAELLHEDETGRLYEVEFNPVHHMATRTRIRFVRVLNSTPEPDGTFKEYALRVPPHISTAREAVAWTFGMGAEEYQPKLET